MNSFDLKPFPTVQFGCHSIEKLTHHVKKYGSRTLILTGAESLRHHGHMDRISSMLDEQHVVVSAVTVSQEPSPETVDTIVEQYRTEKIDVVIAVGGGSVIDTGKAVSAMLPRGNPVVHFLESIGTRKPTGEKIPFIAVPTTSGTGSEATSNAVISRSGNTGFKKSLRHDNYIPNSAIIDPLLMCSCPPHITAACGMDTFSQLVEAYLSTKSSPITDAIAWRGIKSVRQALITVYEHPEEIDGRSQMALASLCSGIALMNAGLGVVHGLAPVLGCSFPMSHGVVCGSLMASANDVTLKKLEAEQDHTEPIAKYTKLGKLFSARKDESDEYYRTSFIEHLYSLTDILRIPRLSVFNVSSADAGTIAATASNKNNPVNLTLEEISDIIRKAV